MLHKRRICLAFVLFAGMFGNVFVSTAYAEAPAEINALAITVDWELEGYPGPDCVIGPPTYSFSTGFHYGTMLYGESDSVAEWFDDVSYGLFEFDGDGTGPYTVTIPCTTDELAVLYDLSIKQAIEAAHEDGYNVWLDNIGGLQGDYDRIILFLNNLSDFGSSVGYGGGNYVVIYGGFVNMKRVVIHELGHTLGLGHAQAYGCGEASFADCGCEVNSYGNPFDIMGSGSGHFSVPGKLDVGWLNNETAVIDVTGSGTFNLTPLATQTGVKALRMAFDDSSDYYFEFRQPVLSDEINGNGLLAYRVPHFQNLWGTYLLDMTPNSTTSDFDDSVLTVGSTYFGADAPIPFSIKPTAMTDSGANAVLSVAVRLSDMTVDLGANVALNSVNPSAVILTPTITGGTGPYTCVWSPDDGCINNPNACTIAVSYDEDCVPVGPDSCTGYSGPLPTTYSVTVTDSSNSPIPMQGKGSVLVYHGDVTRFDCNSNGIHDLTDIAQGTSLDCNENGIPDECEDDDIGVDCNNNGIPDSCEIVIGSSSDCNFNLIPDECETDCNENGIPDDCEIAGSTSPDCNYNGIPDECETDCNSNGIPDDCDIAAGTSANCNNNSIPDECELVDGSQFDCNNNGILDVCDLNFGTSMDSEPNSIPDECQDTLLVPSEYSTIQAALNAANSGDTILVADGTYSGTGNYNLDFSGKILSLISANGSDYCTIDADDNGRVFWFHNGETAYSCVDGFRIINGSATEGGAVLLEQNSAPTIRNCVFSGNDATDGHGGAIYAAAAKPSIYNCIFANNSASDRGGAIYGVGHAGMMVYASSTGIRNCSFLGNSADYGGGVAFGVNPMNVVNCSFSGNYATTSGGGLYVHPSLIPGLNVYDCTIAGNSTDGTGGGVYYNGNYGTLLIENSILWDNTDSDIADPLQLTAQIAIANGSATVNYSCVEQGWSGDGGHNIDDNPNFRDSDGIDNIVGTIDDDLRLSETSPCIDAGNNASVPNDIGDLDGDSIVDEPFPIDLDGFIRFADDPDTEDTGSCGIPCEFSIIDMGAYEFGDCNHNGVPDELDILQGTSVDCNSNSVPDECETDCNSNGIPDDCEEIMPLFLGTADSVGTLCDLVLSSGDSEPRTGGIRQLNFHFECPPSGSPAIFEAECVSCSTYPAQCAAIWLPYSGSSVMNCTPNDLDLECIFDPALEDQTRYQFDFAGIAENDPVWEVRALSSDVNNNGVIDGNDIDSVTQASSPECNLDINEDGVMTYADEMVFWGTWENCAPSSCDSDCNENGVSDVSDIAGGTSIDTNSNGIPDECEPTPPVIESAVSIKEHGPFPPVAYGIDANGVECRSGGISRVRISFNKIAYSEDGDDFVAGDFTLSRGSVQSVNTFWEDQFRPPIAYIDLAISGVTTIGQFTIGFSAENGDGVEDSYEVCWTYILADVNSDGAVDDADEAALIAVNRGNLPSVFWYDLDLDGTIESGSKKHDDLDIWSSVAPVSTQLLCID